MLYFAHFVLAAMLLAAIPQTTQQKPPPEVQEPVVISAAAMKYGVDLKEHASPQLLKWVKKQLSPDLASSPEQLRRLEETLGQEFAQASPELRGAVQFLVFYTGYEAEDETLRGHTRARQDIEREIREIEDRARMRLRDPNFLSQRLDSAILRKGIESRAEALHRVRVDAYLRLLNDHYKDVANVPSESIDQVKPVPGRWPLPARETQGTPTVLLQQIEAAEQRRSIARRAAAYHRGRVDEYLRLLNEQYKRSRRLLPKTSSRSNPHRRFVIYCFRGSGVS